MRIILVCLLLSFTSCTTQNQEMKNELVSEEETAIAKGLIQGAFDDLWGGMDSTKILNYHTDDFIILENGEVWDNDRIKQFMRGRLKNENRPLRINEMEYISIEKYGNSMQIAYDNYATFKQQDTIVGNAHWLESALAVKTAIGWRLKMMHSTYVPNRKN